MRVYCGGDATSYEIPPPHPQPCDGPSLRRACSRREWDVDILSEQGLRKMKEIVLDILAHAMIAGRSMVLVGESVVTN